TSTAPSGPSSRQGVAGSGPDRDQAPAIETATNRVASPDFTRISTLRFDSARASASALRTSAGVETVLPATSRMTSPSLTPRPPAHRRRARGGAGGLLPAGRRGARAGAPRAGAGGRAPPPRAPARGGAPAGPPPGAARPSPPPARPFAARRK